MNELEKRINVAYKFLKRAQANFYLAEKYSAEAKQFLEVTKNGALASGEIKGKNPGEREVAAREVFPDLYSILDEEQKKAAKAKIRLIVAQLEVDVCRTLIRLKEIEIGRLPDAGH